MPVRIHVCAGRLLVVGRLRAGRHWLVADGRRAELDRSAEASELGADRVMPRTSPWLCSPIPSGSRRGASRHLRPTASTIPFRPTVAQRHQRERDDPNDRPDTPENDDELCGGGPGHCPRHWALLGQKTPSIPCCPMTCWCSIRALWARGPGQPLMAARRHRRGAAPRLVANGNGRRCRGRPRCHLPPRQPRIVPLAGHSTCLVPLAVVCPIQGQGRHMPEASPPGALDGPARQP